ncbi:MAG: c-type cytochrome [Gemmatimonadota bacterium]
MHNQSLLKTLAVVLVAGTFAACGDAGDEAPPPATIDPAAAPAETTPEPVPEPEPADAPAADAPAGATPEQIEAGRQVYTGAGICFTCHGQQAEGTPLGPNLNDGDWLWIEDPETDLHTKLVTLIRTGVTQPAEYPAPMPPMGGASLSEEQLESVAWYVVSLNQ